MAGGSIMTAPRPPATADRLTIRPMLTGDIDAVSNLEIEVYPQPWSTKVFREELALANRRYVVAEDGMGVIVGYAGLLLVEEDAHVTTLAVDPRVRRRRRPTVQGRANLPWRPCPVPEPCGRRVVDG